MIKNNNNFILSNVIAERKAYQKMITAFQNELKSLPKGNVTRKLVRGHTYLYFTFITKDEKQKYIQKIVKKEEMPLAEAVLRRKFVEKSLKILYANVKCMEKLEKEYIPFYFIEILEQLPFKLDNSHEMIVTKNDLINAWQKEEYEPCNYYKIKLIHFTTCGIKVRSKSEVIIANLLTANQVPFRYEAKVIIEDQVFYPDFTIMKPKDGEIIYWEHFGMINNKEYYKDKERKRDFYIQNGLIPWDNLIETYDYSDGTINIERIQSIIDAFILN